MICDCSDAMIAEAARLCALGPNIWHGQTMLYNPEATIQIASFLQQCHAIVDNIGGDARKWKTVFSSPQMDVNVMSQIVGILQGLKVSVERGLISMGEANQIPTSERKQFDVLLTEGRKLLQGHDAAETGIAQHRWYDGVAAFLQLLAPGLRRGALGRFGDLPAAFGWGLS